MVEDKCKKNKIVGIWEVSRLCSFRFYVSFGELYRKFHDKIGGFWIKQRFGELGSLLFGGAQVISSASAQIGISWVERWTFPKWAMKESLGCLGYIGDEKLPSFMVDYHKPLKRSLVNNR